MKYLFWLPSLSTLTCAVFCPFGNAVAIDAINSKFSFMMLYGPIDVKLLHIAGNIKHGQNWPVTNISISAYRLIVLTDVDYLQLHYHLKKNNW